MKVAVLPAWNEAASLTSVVAELRSEAPELVLLVVDDASTDRTPELLGFLGVRTLRMPFRVGVGGAVRAGIRWARERQAELVVRVDADGQHPAAALPLLSREVEEGRADACCGSRFLEGGEGDARPYRQAPERRLGAWLLAAGLARILDAPVTDPTSGFWAFGPRAIDLLAGEHPSGYAEPELRLLLHARGLRCREVAVPMRTRHAGRSSITLPRALHAMGRAALAMAAMRAAAAPPPAAEPRGLRVIR